MSEKRVFISYTEADRPLVRSALKWLRESDLHGAKVDDPADWTAPGDDVRRIITEKMRKADTMVLLWSDTAARSPWVQYELGMAQALNVPIRVLMAGGSQTKLPETLNETDVVRLATEKGSPPGALERREIQER